MADHNNNFAVADAFRCHATMTSASSRDTLSHVTKSCTDDGHSDVMSASFSEDGETFSDDVSSDATNGG